MESNPSKIPNDARHFEEPFVKLDIVCPDQYNGAILELCQVLPNSYFSLF